MYKKRFDESVRALKHGKLIVVVDDVEHKGSALVGTAEKVSSYNVNRMTKLGKGLVCACITQQKAKELSLSFMVNKECQYQSRIPFTVSVDFCSSTTGISSLERSDTIYAFVDKGVVTKDFVRPGHIFPIVCKDRRLLENISLTDAAIELVEAGSSEPVAYMCQILNTHGNLANAEESVEISKINNLNLIYISDLLKVKEEIICTIRGRVVKGKKIGRGMGFPTANLSLPKKSYLEKGVYGVTVYHNNNEYNGVMNVGSRPTLLDDGEITNEIHIFDFNKCIYGDELTVNVCFFLREEKMFPSFKHLIEQIKKDIENVQKRFEICETKKLIIG
ncbi:3,4-dihydroxy-2-butanone-4-phosphate synthase [Mesobacillus harenae]|uniref:3,4-dihydroxy-2-butanone-4-phosphate synthase n=1 Tax=Mesobacillus harenae TaxID=2213203 RepID=UPI001580DD74|nr:3,4-dihydroxy-2-butanone-4-phosphate synthase [Mesobacillus harenae]